MATPPRRAVTISAGELGRAAQTNAAVLELLADESDLQRVEIKDDAIIASDCQHLAKNGEDALLTGVTESQRIEIARAAGCLRQW